MSDEHQPDEQSLTKRERQKMRRQQKLERQRVEARKARRRRTVILGVVVLLLVGTTGALAAQWALDRAEERRLVAEAQENLEALGCTTVEDPPNLGAGHFSGPELASNPPDVIYPDRPTTSGRHVGNVVQTGVYDKVIDERILVHNMEHGYVNVYYADDAPAEQVEDLKEFAREQISSRRHEKLIVSAWKDDLPEDVNFALTAWGARQLCREWDRGVALGFLDDWHWLAGDAPERTLPAHTGDSGGGLDPNEEEGDMLLPPLTDDPADIGDDIMETPPGDAEDAEDAGETEEAGETEDS